MQATQKPISGLNQEDIRNWFDKLISHISVDKIMMETNTAPTEIKEFYTNAMLDDYHKMSKAVRDQSTKYFIVKLLEDYLSELKSFKIFPQKLAFDFSDAKILVWAQISNEDEKAEDALILSEAAGFYVSSTIVEESDNLKIPPHYHEVKIHGGLSSSH
jgi:hypothetical protein